MALPWVVLLLFIVRSRLLVYSAGSGVNRVQVVLSGFSKRLFCFVRQKLCVGMVVCISGCTRTSVCGCDCDVICIGHDLNRLHWVVVSLRCKC